MENYLDFLNSNEKKYLEGYNLVEDLSKIEIGDYIKYIKRDNLQFKQGGKVIKKYNTSLIINNIKYKYNYPLDIRYNILFCKKNIRVDKNLEFIKYLENGLKNDVFKITKKQ